MTIKPSETAPQSVPDHPGWAWWPGVAGLVYAKRPNGIDPPIVVRAHNFTALLARIRAKEGVAEMKVALNIERDDLERRFPHREVWWLPETKPGGGQRITWHSRVRGALNADVHGDSAEHLGEYMAKADAEEGP